MSPGGRQGRCPWTPPGDMVPWTPFVASRFVYTYIYCALACFGRDGRKERGYEKGIFHKAGINRCTVFDGMWQHVMVRFCDSDAIAGIRRHRLEIERERKRLPAILVILYRKRGGRLCLYHEQSWKRRAYASIAKRNRGMRAEFPLI